ncbi:HAD family phosphatase [bacterium]|nr:HAD family phosphatase [bacterium]MCB2179228.1 HAD family phosphatase [bacterium]
MEPQQSFNNFAVLWDMDGVLVDTGNLHYLTWQQALAEVDFSLSKEAFLSTFGQNNNSIIKLWFGEDVTPQFIQQISERKEELFRQQLQGNVHLLPDVRTWLANFQQWGLKQAVASSAPMENIDALVDVFEIRGYFDALVSGEKLPGKPNPDVYLKAAEEVSIAPERCVVIEDAVHGVEGAKAAGMRCIAVQTTNTAAALAKADLIVEDLTKLAPSSVQAFLV